jgi:hypothetical protein
MPPALEKSSAAGGSNLRAEQPAQEQPWLMMWWDGLVAHYVTNL